MALSAARDTSQHHTSGVAPSLTTTTMPPHLTMSPCHPTATPPQPPLTSVSTCPCRPHAPSASSPPHGTYAPHMHLPNADPGSPYVPPTHPTAHWPVGPCPNPLTCSPAPTYMSWLYPRVLALTHTSPAPTHALWPPVVPPILHSPYPHDLAQHGPPPTWLRPPPRGSPSIQCILAPYHASWSLPGQASPYQHAPPASHVRLPHHWPTHWEGHVI